MRYVWSKMYIGIASPLYQVFPPRLPPIFPADKNETHGASKLPWNDNIAISGI